MARSDVSNGIPLAPKRRIDYREQDGAGGMGGGWRNKVGRQGYQ